MKLEWLTVLCDDLIKRDREKLRLKISRLNRELDLEDRIDDADTRAWNCDFAGDPIFCLNEIIRELENIKQGEYDAPQGIIS